MDDDRRVQSSRINAAKLPKEVDAKLRKELTRLSKQPYSSAEASVLRELSGHLPGAALDGCAPRSGLTWRRRGKVLDADHYGLDKVKERILEFLAVQTAGPRSEGADHLPGGPSRRGQDLDRHVHGQSHEPEDGPDLPGRRPR